MKFNIETVNRDLFGNMIQSPATFISDFEKQKPSIVPDREVSERSYSDLGTQEKIAIMKPHSIVEVNVYRSAFKRLHNDKRIDNLNNQNGNDNTYNGYLSPGATREIKRRLEVWLTAIDTALQLSKQKKMVIVDQVLPTFVTLTLPSAQSHSDYSIKKYVLDPFLSWLKVTSKDVFKTGINTGKQKGFGVECFFWRAEAQKNGNIHFHIVCDRFIPWQRIRQKWNSLVESFGGYVSSYHYGRKRFFKDGFSIDYYKLDKDIAAFIKIFEETAKARRMPDKCPEYLKKWLALPVKNGKIPKRAVLKAIALEKQKEDYAIGEACNWTNPNTTDIHGVQGLKSIASYVVKYVTKKGTEKPLEPNQFLKTDSVTGRKCLFERQEVVDPETGEVTVNEVQLDIEEYRPTLEERKIEGKIWGTSEQLTPKKTQLLHEDKDGTVYYEDRQSMVVEEFDKPFRDSLVLDEGKVFYRSPDGRKYHIGLDIDGESERVVRVKRHYELKYFTKVLSEQVLYRIEGNRKEDSKVLKSEPMVVDQEALDYVNGLVNDIGAELIDRISDKVGDSFKMMEGRIIPLMSEKLGYKLDDKGKAQIVPHGKILANRSPKLKMEYDQYYLNIFEAIYQN
ncbi:hypothetical protein SAMN06298216_4449 [Spirosomataceae bacterium TFI 002]|nr:hypothetical protein SAMN06298216_4449 [Spirosomataceae bacterium TFI 002]